VPAKGEFVVSESQMALTDHTSWFWNAVGKEVEGTLSVEQRQAIENAVKRSSHVSNPADVRLSFGTFFVRIISGKERRGGPRLREDRKAHPVIVARNFPVLAAFWIAATFTSLYIAGFVISLLARLVF
jgi:hypothetical protein